MNYHLTSIIWEEDGQYVSKCPELEVSSWGYSPEEAKDNLMDAVALFLENAKLLGIMDDIMPSLKAEHKITSVFEVPA